MPIVTRPTTKGRFVSARGDTADGLDPIVPSRSRVRQPRTIGRHLGMLGDRAGRSDNTNEAREWASEVWRAVRRLAPADRDVIHLIYVARLTQVDVARYLGMSVAEVKHAAAEGLQELGRQLPAQARRNADGADVTPPHRRARVSHHGPDGRTADSDGYVA